MSVSSYNSLRDDVKKHGKLFKCVKARFGRVQKLPVLEHQIYYHFEPVSLSVSPYWAAVRCWSNE